MISKIVISELIESKITLKYFIGYFDEFIRPLVLILPKMSGYVKTFRVKTKSKKLMSFRIDDEKLLETIWTKIEDLKNIRLNTLPVYDVRCIKIKIRIYGDESYTNFRGLIVPENDIERESFTVISLNSLLVYKNKYLQVYLDNCAYKISDK